MSCPDKNGEIEDEGEAGGVVSAGKIPVALCSFAEKSRVDLLDLLDINASTLNEGRSDSAFLETLS